MAELLALLLCLGGDDPLLPTHLFEAGQVYISASYRYQMDMANRNRKAGFPFNTVFEADVESTFSRVQLDAGVGLGKNFELDASFSYGRLEEETTQDAGSVEYHRSAGDFSDLNLTARVALVREDAARPQFVVGAIVVAPVGNDKKGQVGERAFSPVTLQVQEVQEQKEGGLGRGVWSYGFEAGISKRLTVAEPYFKLSYIIGGKRHVRGVEEDRADVGNLLLGAQWHLSPTFSLDTRASVTWRSVDVTERDMVFGPSVEDKNHSHIEAGGEVAGYFRLGGGVTLTLGSGASFIESHRIKDYIFNPDFEGGISWFVQVGLVVVFPTPASP